MTAVLLVSSLLLWALALFLGFLLLGALRAQGLLEWRLEQLEATMPSRIGRSGLAPGKHAPDFTLQRADGRDVSLHDFAGQRVLLVFVQSGCGPCHEIVPELNKLRRRRTDLALVAINHASPQDAQQWADETRAEFPVLVQEDWSVSKRYEAFATPFAFVIDGQGIVRSKGIVAKGDHIDYLLSGADSKSPSFSASGSEPRQKQPTPSSDDAMALEAAADG